MRIRLPILLFLMIMPLQGMIAQRGIINKGALIVVSNNAVINIKGGSNASYVSQTNGSFQGRMDLNGKIYLDGSWVNNTTGGNGLINIGTDGETILQGTSLQIIGGSQPTYFEKLTLNNSAGAVLSGSVNLYGNLGLTSGLLTLGTNNLLLSSNTSITGTPSSAAMIIADGTGELRKNFSGSGSFLFPVGDNTSVAEYTPATLNFSSGTFGAGAWAGVRVVNTKHPSNTSSSAYISRYWAVSQNNISSFSCTPSFTYTDADITGTEANLYGGLYVSPFWKLLNSTSTGSNTFSGTVTSLGDFTAGQSNAFSVSFTMADDGLISEGAENNEVITVNLFNATFAASLNPANWSISNQPQGVTIGSVYRVSNTQATVTLSGNRTKDYDSDISNMNLTIGYQELNNLTSGTVNANSGITFKALNDAENITMTDDGNITEGSIAGEKIYITVNGGTFVQTLNSSNWSLTNMPSGISIGSVTRTGINTAEITLTGTAADYDTDITNTTLSINAAEIDEYTGANLSANTGVRFIAIDESLVISMANDAGGIQEGAENGEVITVTISSKTFNSTLTPSQWTLTNLPQGVTLGSVSRTDATHAALTLSGNRTKDYDTDITNVTLQIGIGEIVSQSSVATINSGVTLTANNDAESLSISSGTINEAAENGAVISVTLTSGTYASSLDKTHWIISNLPSGVTIGSVTRNSSTLATITLSGNRIIDYDSDIILSLAVNQAEIDDYTGADLVPYSGVAKLTANNDNEVLSMSDDGITEGAEDGKIITVNLTGGTIINPINPDNWVLTNLPSGVSKGSVNRISSTQVQITLSGNTIVDYDVNITNCTLTVNAAEIDDNATGVSVSSGVTFSAIDEPVSLSLTDNGITEGAEDGKIITATLSQDVFVASLNPASWTISNLPSGVTVESLVRTDGTQVNIILSGNRTKDYDNNITDLSVTIAGSQLTAHTSSPVAATSGVIFNAINDAESLSMSNDTQISEGTESGKTITVTLTGGTFSSTLNPANWSISGQPTGVSLGSLQRLSDTQVRITLSGNRTVDYDLDITDMQLSVNEAEVDDYSGSNLNINNGVTFNAVLETLSLDISAGSITEGAEDGSQITITLSGGTWVSSLDLANWTVSNLPAGVSKSSISRSNSTQTVITLSGNRSVDYDTDITSVTVTCKAPEIVAYAGADITSSTGIVLTANDEQLSASNASLSETNLQNAIIALTLTNESFATSNPNKSNYILNNAPAGSSVASVTYVDPTHVNLNIAYDSASYDFDSDIPNFSITIQAPELNGVASITSNDLYISAVAEAVSAKISSDVALDESNLDGNLIHLTLVNETFTDNSLSNSNFQLVNVPPGLSVSSVQWLTATTANINLAFNGTDFDVDYNNWNLLIDGSELMGNASLTTNNLPITAVIEIPDLQISVVDSALSERNLNHAKIQIELINDYFGDNILDAANFELINAPSGCETGSLYYQSPTTAILEISFDSTDFDQDFTSLELTINSIELGSGTSITSSNTLLVKAYVEPVIATISAMGDLSEANLDGGQISLSLTNASFAQPELDATSFELLNAPAGVTVDTIFVQSATQAIVQFAYDQTDFDVDAVFSISINPNAVASYNGSNLVTNELLLPAVIEDQSAQLSSASTLIEDQLNGAILTLTLVNDSFAVNSLDPSQLLLFGETPGIEISKIEVTDLQHASITLSFRGDFDTDIAGIGVSIPGNVLLGKRSISTNQLPVTAVIEPVSALISHPGLTGANLNGAEILIELVSVTFQSTILPASEITLYNAPAGCTINSVLYQDDSHAIVQLSYDGTAFSSDIENFHLVISGALLSDGSDLQTNNLTILNVGIPGLTAEANGLTEQNLNGSSIMLTLNNASFTDEKLANTSFVLHNAPSGCSVDTVIYIDAYHAALTLSFDGTNFSNDIPDFNISINPSELTGVSEELSSNNMVITAITGVSSVSSPIIAIYAYGNKVFIHCDEPLELEGYAVVFNIAGQAVATKTLSKSTINTLELTSISRSYVVKVYNRKKIYTGKVTLIGY